MSVVGRMYTINHINVMKISNDEVIASGFADYNNIDISWDLNKICQYRCSYCFVDLVRKDGSDTNGAFKSVLKRLKLKSTPEFNITILGGEPTLHPEFKNIVKDLVNNTKCLRLGIVTNLAQSVDYYKEILTTNKVYMLASYHPEYVKLDVYMNKCISLAKICKNFKCSVNLHHNKKYWSKTIELINFLITNEIDFTLNILYDTRTGDNVLYDYTNEFYETFSEYQCYFSGDEHFLIMGGASVDIKIPYNTSTATLKIDIKDIREKELHKFNNYHCIPRMIDIDYLGIFRNSCTGEIIRLTAGDYNNCIVCPVEGGCKCVEMLYYYKTKTI